MSHLRLIDGMSILRARLEKDPTGLLFRALYYEQCACPHIPVWVWDGPGNIKTRRNIYPGYKINRQPASESIWDGINLWKQLLSHSKAISITLPGFEADDVIAALAERHVGKMPIVVETRDFDLYQLAIPGKVECVGAQTKPVPTHKIRLYKTWVGDQSDDVKGVGGFGAGAWEKADHHQLAELTKRIVAEEKLTVEEIMAYGLAKRCANWLFENPDVFRAMWTIVGFIRPTDQQIDAATTPGVLSKTAGEEVLRNFML